MAMFFSLIGGASIETTFGLLDDETESLEYEL